MICLYLPTLWTTSNTAASVGSIRVLRYWVFLREMDSHHSIQTPSIRPSLPLCQTIYLMPTLYNSTNPAPYRIEFGDPTIRAYHHENKTCTCDHLDWIIVHDIPFPLHDGDHFTLSSWPGIIFQFLQITDQEPFQSTTQGSFWVAEFLITGSQYIPSTIISNHVSVDQFEVRPFLTPRIRSPSPPSPPPVPPSTPISPPPTPTWYGWLLDHFVYKFVYLWRSNRNINIPLNNLIHVTQRQQANRESFQCAGLPLPHNL